MKNFIIFILLLCATMNVNAKESFSDKLRTDGKELASTLYNDGKEVVSTVYNDGKNAIVEMYPDVKSAIVSIAQGIGVAAEHVYTVLVKKYVVMGIKEVLIFSLGVILFLIGFISIWRYINNNKIMTWKLIPLIILTGSSVLIILSVNFDNMLMGLVNPEFGAINYILDYAKSFV